MTPEQYRAVIERARATLPVDEWRGLDDAERDLISRALTPERAADERRSA